MAVGDVVAGTFAATGNFQPAAGVNVVITALTYMGGGESWNLYNGANAAIIVPATGVFPAGQRVALNNTNYLRVVLVGVIGTYGGMQTR